MLTTINKQRLASTSHRTDTSTPRRLKKTK
jgi:hypothetical protein